MGAHRRRHYKLIEPKKPLGVVMLNSREFDHAARVTCRPARAQSFTRLIGKTAATWPRLEG